MNEREENGMRVLNVQEQERDGRTTSDADGENIRIKKEVDENEVILRRLMCTAGHRNS